MGLRTFLIPVVAASLLAGCSQPVPKWRLDAQMALDRVRMEGAGTLLPQELKSAEEIMLKGDAYLERRKVEQADYYYWLAWSKGNLLENDLAAEKLRREEELQKRVEAENRELLRRQALLEKLQRRQASEKAEAEARARAKAEAEARRKAEKVRQTRERQLPAYHTVKRGETLPLISAQSDIYSDPALWPLLYRANRDQISDPKHIWPGQVLRIPRNASREDLAEARRYAQERPIY